MGKHDAKPKEIIVELDQTFDHVIGRLNRILKFEKTNQGRQTQKLIGLFKSTPDPESLGKILGYYCDEKKYFSSVRKIFEGDVSLAPFVGDKAKSKRFGNKGMVVGLKGQSFSYRVDYDDKKKLHINLETKAGFKFALCVKKLGSPRFGINDEEIKIRQEEKRNNFKAIFTKFKFWIKMTFGFFSATESSGSAFEPFHDSEDYEFSSFKDKITSQYGIDYYDDDGIKTKIEACNDEKALSNLIFSSKKLRHSIINQFVENVSKGEVARGMLVPKESPDNSESDSTCSVSDSSDEEVKSNKSRQFSR